MGSNHAYPALLYRMLSESFKLFKSFNENDILQVNTKTIIS